MSLDLDKILRQLRGFDVTEFEKSLSPEEVELFRPYIICYHRMALKYERALNLLREYGLDPEN